MSKQFFIELAKTSVTFYGKIIIPKTNFGSLGNKNYLARIFQTKG
jgi:hypothetical protein